MKKWLPLLVVLMGAGCSFSFSQTPSPSNFVDPFDLYLKSEQGKRPQVNLVRFATECGVDLDATTVRFAYRPDNTWLVAGNLAKGIHGIETDVFETVAVRMHSNRILVELWVMQLDVGSEARRLYCIEDRKVTLFEVVEWTLPVEERTGKTIPGWGFEQRWKVDPVSGYISTLRQFVDARDHQIPAPKLDGKTMRDLHWTPEERSWSDLKLPAALLQ